MNEEKEDPILAAPNPVKEESTISTAIDKQPGESTTQSVDSSDDKEKIRQNYDERRISLLNNPSYGVILCFLDKFRAHVDLQDYPLHLLEENLLSDQENTSRRLIDFHLTLLKRISLGKGAHRDKFCSVITKFAYRFDYDDGEHLRVNGYSQAQIDIKLRILKNLLETQFDHNQALKTAILEKPSFEVRSQAFGRDRSGASYWLFMDAECFVRIFREDVDDDRTWNNIVKDKDELENLIKLLITDNAVRKKFPDWKFNHEPLNTFEVSDEFEKRYMPIPIQIKKEEEDVKQTHSPLPCSSSTVAVKTTKERKNKREKPLSPPLVKTEIESDHESIKSEEKIVENERLPSSDDTKQNELTKEINNNQEDSETKSSTKKARGRRKSRGWSKKKRPTVSNASKKDEQENAPTVSPPKTSNRGRKRKQITDNEEEIDDIQKNEKDEHTEMKRIDQMQIDDDSNFANDLPIALRRSKRVRKAAAPEIPTVTSSPTKSIGQNQLKKKLPSGKTKSSSQINLKASSQTAKTNGSRKRGRRRAKSSSDDEEQPTEDEDDYDSDDYLPEKQNAELSEEDLLEEEENDEEYVPRRSAKTVAKRRGQMNENNTNEDLQSSSSACCVCSKTDRPESLLLCDDCDDPYHLDCLRPILLTVPDGNWYCPLCEHKRLSDNLIEKLIQLIKEHDELEVKRKQCMTKRSSRLANVMLNLDLMVKRSSKKRRTNGIVYSDEENEDDEDNKSDEQEENEQEDAEEEEEEENDDDDGSVYGFKDDESDDGFSKRKRSKVTSKARRDEQPETLGVRSCRRKPQNYRFDDYDKKMKEAMMHAGVNGDEIENELDESDDEELKSSKKRTGYGKDDDFDVSNTKNDDEFAPEQNLSDESESTDDEYNDDESSDDGAWKNKRRTSTRKKPTLRTTRGTRRRVKIKSDDDDDDSFSDNELSNLQATLDTTRSETTNDVDPNETGNDDRRRSARATTQKNYAKQQDGSDDDDDDDDDEDLFINGRPPPRRMRYKKRLGSDDSFVDDDDDYEKLAQKRKIVKYGKSVARSSISDHIKKLVDDNSQSNPEKSSEPSAQVMKENSTDNSNKPADPPSTGYAKAQPSDDDDFPDEQEIFKSNGLMKLQKTFGAPPPQQPTSFRPPFMPPIHSYQHAIVDPTARFAMIRPPVRPAINNGYPYNGYNVDFGDNQQPSDPNQVNRYFNPPL